MIENRQLTLEGKPTEAFQCANLKTWTSYKDWEDNYHKCSPECPYETCDYRTEHGGICSRRQSPYRENKP